VPVLPTVRSVLPTGITGRLWATRKLLPRVVGYPHTCPMPESGVTGATGCQFRLQAPPEDAFPRLGSASKANRPRNQPRAGEQTQRAVRPREDGNPHSKTADMPFDAAPVRRCGNLHHRRRSPLPDNIAGQAALMPASRQQPPKAKAVYWADSSGRRNRICWLTGRHGKPTSHLLTVKHAIWRRSFRRCC
jgi:hypothetical protein